MLSVHANHSEADTLVQVVVEGDTQGEVGAGIKRAGALVVIDGGSSEGVFKDPVGAGLRSLETGAGAVASGVDAILVVEVDHGHNSSDINTLEVPDAATIVRRSLKLRELILGDLSLADGPIVVVIS